MDPRPGMRVARVLALLAAITLAGCAAKPPAGGDGFYNPGHSSGGGGGV
jgi:type IV pilus biogenesis protein CpaD/CtpE